MKVGDKVVCINNSNLTNVSAPIIDKIYTIRIIRPDSFSPNIIGICLEEIHNGINLFSGMEYGYIISRFRKVDESFAEEVLSNIKEQIEEEQLVLV